MGAARGADRLPLFHALILRDFKLDIRIAIGHGGHELKLFSQLMISLLCSPCMGAAEEGA